MEGRCVFRLFTTSDSREVSGVAARFVISSCRRRRSDLQSIRSIFMYVKCLYFLLPIFSFFLLFGTYRRWGYLYSHLHSFAVCWYLKAICIFLG
uniref:Uncharacterized protein n=1 Tax=Anguilla anguilla TaxID=7936 RepID=A0A0E9WZR0_ANGAN